MSCEFTDASMMARKHPDTFERPGEDELEALHPGDFVKVCTADERFWVKLTNVAGENLEGVVDNDLICTDDHGLKLGDVVLIEVDHVYSVLTAETA